MKKIFFLMIMIITFFAIEARSESGGKTFIALKCNRCHYISEDTLGPPLKLIALAYEGKRERLVRFLNGEEKPIVMPDKFLAMEPNISNTKALSDAERRDLADFMLQFNKKKN